MTFSRGRRLPTETVKAFNDEDQLRRRVTKTELTIGGILLHQTSELALRDGRIIRLPRLFLLLYHSDHPGSVGFHERERAHCCAGGNGEEVDALNGVGRLIGEDLRELHAGGEIVDAGSCVNLEEREGYGLVLKDVVQSVAGHIGAF